MAYVIPQEILAENRKKEDVGFFESALAGVATGLWNIPKGFVSLGAELYDITGDTNTSKDVEKWFDDVNPFDDEAEARTIGKITQAISQIAPVGVAGFAAGARAGALAKKALDAKKSGKALSLTNIGSKIVGPTSGGIVGSGIGEALVSDQDIGTFADMVRGTSLEPYALTIMDIEEKEGREEAFRKLLNRLKFGTEGALFNLALMGTGRVIKKLREPSETGIEQYSESPLGRALQKFGIAGLKPEGTGTKATLEAQQLGFGNIKVVEFAAGREVENFDKALKDIFPKIENQYLIADKSITNTDQAQKKFLEEIYEVLRPKKGEESLLTPQARQKIRLETKEGVTKLKATQGTFDFAPRAIDKPRSVFTIDDYQVSSKLKDILNKVKTAGGDPEQVKNAILNFRLSIDNMSGRLLQGGMPEEVAKSIESQLGSYLTSEYKQFNRLIPLGKYKVTKEQIDKSIDLLVADKEKAYLLKSKGEPLSIAEKTRIQDSAKKEVEQFLKIKSIDQVDVTDPSFKSGVDTVIDRASKQEIEAVKVNPSILNEKVLKPWQEELAGIIKDPRYTFYSTVGKQAHLNYTLRYMDQIDNIGSKGPNKFVFNAEELSNAEKNDPLKFKLVKPSDSFNGLSKLENKYVRAPVYDAIFDVTSNWLNRSSVGTAYKYMILAPKAVSQVAKTILSPITHVRNFISAGAFAAANGAIFPSYGDIKMLAPKFVGGEGILSKAYDITGKRVFGTMTKADQELYERLLRVGVADSAIQPGETKRLIKDVMSDPALAEKKAMRGLLNVPEKAQKIYGKIQDAYVAEDEFWKYITWNLERNRYENVLTSAGINKDNYLKILAEESDMGKFLRKMTPRQEVAAESYQGFLDEIAGNLARNQVPNYGYIGRTAKALRQSPFGNFISFPIEIVRTGNNIMSQAIDEITSGIPGVAAIGYRRLFSFGTTVGGIPLAMSEYFKAQNNVTDDEITALRRFVPEWSKNSTLLPTGRDEKGYLKYIDFSYSNAYDTLIRPFNAVLNAISQSDGTNESLKQALGKGITDGVVDLMEPFASESIFTEALIDSTFRRGVGRGGKRVWSEEDDPFVKIGKGIAHISESFTPGSLSQLKRLSESSVGKSDKYGKTFELKDELPGLFGFRSIQSDPERGLDFMTTRFSSSLKKDENLFTSPLLKGGRVSPEEVLNRYQYSESRRFQTMKEMYKNIDAARKLGVNDSTIRKELEARKGLPRDIINSLMRGNYLPDEPSEFFIEQMRKINNNLNEKERIDLPNPYFEALPKIKEIINKNKNLNLLIDEIKIPEEVQQTLTSPTSSLPTPNVPSTGAVKNTNVAQNMLGTRQQYASLFPNDVLGQAIANKPTQIVG
jgi:hypothetical protein